MRLLVLFTFSVAGPPKAGWTVVDMKAGWKVIYPFQK